MVRHSKPTTAADLARRLEQNPDYVKMVTAVDAERLERDTARKLEQTRLLQELKSVDVNVTSVWQLVNSPNYYTAALPILVKHLRLPHTPKIREGIARSLAVPEARFAWDVLLSEYKALSDETDHAVKAAIALAISASATSDVAKELAALIRDRRHGTSRLFLLIGLKRLKTPETIRALDDLKDDPDLAKEISSWRR